MSANDCTTDKKFCRDCKHLNTTTEELEKDFAEESRIKNFHFCSKYGARLFNKGNQQDILAVSVCNYNYK